MNTYQMLIDDEEHSSDKIRINPQDIHKAPLRALSSAPKPHVEPSRREGADDESMRFLQTYRNGETILRIEGRLDANTALEIRPVLDDLVCARPRRIRVDLRRLELIDSSGLGAIISLFKRVRNYGGDLRLVGTQGQPLAIFKLLRLDHTFSL